MSVVVFKFVVVVSPFHKKPYTYIKVYGFFVFAVKGRINMTELQLNVIREGRPHGVAPTLTATTNGNDLKR
jgi:hypothetical protein